MTTSFSYLDRLPAAPEAVRIPVLLVRFLLRILATLQQQLPDWTANEDSIIYKIARKLLI